MTATAPARADLITAAQDVLATYSHPITIRQLYYRLVAREVIANSQREYKRLVAAMTAARKGRLIGAQVFDDLTRRSTAPYCFRDLGSYMRSVRDGFARDPWQSQKHYVELWVEKEALATVFQPVCNDLLVRLVICRGYPSISSLYAAAQRLHARASNRQVHIVYFGDHDPSGCDIDRNIADEIDFWSPSFRDLRSSVQRIALTPAQIAEHELPPAPPKETDSRTPRFAAEHGDLAVELDALEPDVLEALIRDSVRRWITDPDAWASDLEVEEGERARLADFIDHLNEEGI